MQVAGMLSGEQVSHEDMVDFATSEEVNSENGKLLQELVDRLSDSYPEGMPKSYRVSSNQVASVMS